jgi:hypothetical protein
MMPARACPASGLRGPAGEGGPFTGRLLRLAARFSPPEMAFEYRPRERAARRVFAVSVPDLADPAVPLSPEAAASRLLRRTDWPFPPALISRPQLARLLGRIRAAQPAVATASFGASFASGSEARPSASEAHPPADLAAAAPTPEPLAVPDLCALAATARSSAVMDPLEQAAVHAGEYSEAGLAPVPVYRVSARRRAKAEVRYHRRGDEYAHGLMDLRLSASGGPTLLRLAADELDDEDDDDVLARKLETMSVGGEEDDDLFV